MSNYIHRRDDVSPQEGLPEHGDVRFADPTNKKYPLENAGHVRSAGSYINNEERSADKDRADEVETIKSPIRRAAKTLHVEIKTD